MRDFRRIPATREIGISHRFLIHHPNLYGAAKTFKAYHWLYPHIGSFYRPTFWGNIVQGMMDDF